MKNLNNAINQLELAHIQDTVSLQEEGSFTKLKIVYPLNGECKNPNNVNHQKQEFTDVDPLHIYSFRVPKRTHHVGHSLEQHFTYRREEKYKISVCRIRRSLMATRPDC